MSVLDQEATETHVAWYAIMTKPRGETLAQRFLQSRGYQTFFPHYSDIVNGPRGTSHLSKKAYIPRYVFVGLRSERSYCESLYEVGRAAGVSTVVYAPGGTAFPIPNSVMQELIERADATGLIYGSKKAKKQFSGKKGDIILLGEKAGAYQGFLAAIERLDGGDKIRVELEAHGRKAMLTVTPDHVAEIVQRIA